MSNTTNQQITVVLGLNVYLEITVRYPRSEDRKVSIDKYQMAAASGPANIGSVMKSLSKDDENAKRLDCHLFAITGPKDSEYDPIGAKVLEGLEQELGQRGIKLYSRCLRAKLPISNNIIEEEGITTYEKGIRCKPDYELDEVKEKKEGGILKRIEDLVSPSCGDIWIVLASIAREDVQLAQLILGMKEAERAKKVVILSGELIRDKELRQKRDEIIRSADYLIQNEEETRALLKEKDLKEGSPWEWVAELKKMGSNNVIVTLAEGGAVTLDENGDIFFQQAFRVKPIDPTGAGDAFVGGFLCARCMGKCLQECLRYGAAAGAVQMTILGGRPGVTLKRVKAMLNSR